MASPFLQTFKRLDSQKNKYIQHFIRLRENKQYRTEQNAVIVQGLKTINELHKDGVPIHSLALTADKQPPSNDVLDDLHALGAQHNYLIDNSLTRRILGTASRPGRHEVFAQIPIPSPTLPNNLNRLVVFNHIMDPGNLGNLIRTSKALEWNAGVVVGGTCDVYNDKTLRASRALSLRWPHHTVDSTTALIEFLASYDVTPLVADMLPMTKTGLWSPHTGAFDPTHNPANVGSGIWLWNFDKRGKNPEMPKRLALILSSEHNGVQQALQDQIKVSLPMAHGVESLNVASAGGLLMNELNRLIKHP